MLTDMGSILSGLPKGEGSGEINKRERVYGQHFQARIFQKTNYSTSTAYKKIYNSLWFLFQ